MVTIFVEGGGNTKALRAECRQAFQELFRKAGFKSLMPRAVAAGPRDAAFKAFRNSIDKPVAGEFVVLLVDSETIPAAANAWTHLKSRDQWKKPVGATNDQAQLMVASMETWLISDPGALADYFGRNFKRHQIPTGRLEERSKDDVYKAIKMATSAAIPKGQYGKARDSFKLLARIDPARLRASCSWAHRFFTMLETHSRAATP